LSFRAALDICTSLIVPAVIRKRSDVQNSAVTFELLKLSKEERKERKKGRKNGKKNGK
jgi:hypothetical protein